jgi:hypothetical protein
MNETRDLPRITIDYYSMGSDVVVKNAMVEAGFEFEDSLPLTERPTFTQKEVNSLTMFSYSRDISKPIAYPEAQRKAEKTQEQIEAIINRLSSCALSTYRFAGNNIFNILPE